MANLNGAGGRPPKPTERKRLAGNPGQRRLPEPKATLVATDGPPPPPDSLNEVGIEAWDRLWTAAQQWLSPKTDLNLMTRLCEAYQYRVEVREEITTAGWFAWKPNAAGTHQELIAHPAVGILDRLDAKILAMEGRAGFTPSDRVRLGVEVVKGEAARSKLEELQHRRRSRRSA